MSTEVMYALGDHDVSSPFDACDYPGEETVEGSQTEFASVVFT
jgi:hypothetical protein